MDRIKIPRKLNRSIVNSDAMCSLVVDYHNSKEEIGNYSILFLDRKSDNIFTGSYTFTKDDDFHSDSYLEYLGECVVKVLRDNNLKPYQVDIKRIYVYDGESFRRLTSERLKFELLILGEEKLIGNGEL